MARCVHLCECIVSAHATVRVVRQARVEGREQKIPCCLATMSDMHLHCLRYSRCQSDSRSYREAH
eukprot:m.599418 g.599418  ORF g.599418 m.599418 type:complete len:65 (+) comp22425_c0_seq2:387-581(+)